MDAGICLLPEWLVGAVGQGGDAVETTDNGITSSVMQQQRLLAGQIRQTLALLRAVD